MYGIRGVMYNWIKDYLTNRQQYVSLQDVRSSSLCVTCGVPQGSVLGPLLFLIYVHDIGNVLFNKTVKSFADDTNIFIFHQDISMITRMRGSAIRSVRSQW